MNSLQSFRHSTTANLDPLEIRYCYGYARLMQGASLSLSGSDEDKAIVEPVLPDVLDMLFKAYCTSAIRGRAVAFWIDNGVIRWDSTQSAYYLGSKAESDRVHWKAFEDLPLWRSSAYAPYLELIQSLPGLLTRLELIEIEDSELKKVLSPNEFSDRITQVSELLNTSLRNDGFLVHGPGVKITVHHRQSSAVVTGLDALKDHVLACTDYTEQRLWAKRSVGGGLAGVDEAERAFEQSQVLTRLKTCYEPVIRLWLDSMGIDLKCEWTIGNDDRMTVAETELKTAQAAKLNIESGIATPESYAARYTGGEGVGLYPEISEPEVSNVD